MAEGTTEAPQHQNILRWQGILAGESWQVRLILFVMQFLLSCTLTFTSTGFISIMMQNGYSLYLIMLLVPIAIAAILFGTISCTLFSFMTGAILLFHATYLPLDYYEIVLVTPSTTLGLLPLCGLLLGICFAAIARLEIKNAQRLLLICLACLMISFVCSMGYALRAAGLATGGRVWAVHEWLPYVLSFSPKAVSDMESSLSIYSVIIRSVIQTVFMALGCIVFYVVISKAQRLRDDISIRTVFHLWLLNALLASFMLATIGCYLGIDKGLLIDAESDMRTETNYLCLQIEGSSARSERFYDFIKASNTDVDHLNDEAQSALLDIMMPEGFLLDGYNVNNTGIVFIAREGIIYMSDSALFPPSGELGELVDEDLLAAIIRSIEDDQMQRVLFSGTTGHQDEFASQYGTTQIAYLYARQRDNLIVTIIKPASLVYAGRGISVVRVLIGIGFVFAGLQLLISYLLNITIAKPIDRTNETLGRITAGNLDERATESSTREFRSLSSGINTTVDALNGWIVEARTAIDSELKAARAIQLAALPRKFPALPEIEEFDLYAIMDAAKKVGGDFYDFFLIKGNDEQTHRLGFLIADVSGKGIPAALFMMRAKTLIHEGMEDGLPLSTAVERANASLCEGNEKCMFVTAWVGVLDWDTGRIEYVNAGHNPPVHWHSETARWEWLPKSIGMPLGLMDLPYASSFLECRVGDLILLYTDGVTEATNVDIKLYGDKRLEELLRGVDNPQPKEIIETVRADVARYAEGAEQSDDITMLALKLQEGDGPKETDTFGPLGMK